MSYTNWKRSTGCATCGEEQKKEKIRHSYDFIKEKFKEKDCILLTIEYINSSQKLKYICPNNHTVETTFNIFPKLDKSCVICSGTLAPGTEDSIKDIIRNDRLESVRELFKLDGYILLSNEYKNNLSKLEYKCPKAHIGTTTAGAFKAGYRCPICISKINSNTSEEAKKIIRDDRLEMAREIFKADGYTLLSDKYIDSKSKLKCKCPNNHICAISPTHFKLNIRCTECNNNKSHGELDIKKYFDTNNINYVKEAKFKDCKYKQELPFDFYVNNHFLIEFDGGQHFEICKYFEGKTCFDNTQRNDIIKTKYCITNNIPLLRISYKEIKKIPQIIEKFMKDINIRDKTKPFVYFSNQKLYEHLIKVYDGLTI